MSASLPELHIRKFDLSIMPRDATICIIGKRRTGKSILMKDIMYHFRDIPKGCVFSGTEHCNPFYSNFIPDMYICKDYDPVKLETIFKRQKDIIKRDGGKNDKNNIFIIFDDMLADSASWKKDRQVRELMLNGRHYNVNFTNILQFSLGIPPEMRANMDYVFIFKEVIPANRRRLYDNFGGIIPKFDMFCRILEQCTEDHACLVINNNCKSNKLEDNFFWYKANANLPRFRVGNRNFWRLHDERFIKEESETEIDTASRVLHQYANAKKGVKVVIKRSNT